MTSMFKVTAIWSGFPGAPGYSNFFFEHSDPPSSAIDAAGGNVRAFFNTIKDALTTNVHILVSPEVPVVEDIDGTLVDLLVMGTPPLEVVGTSTQPYAGPAGFCVTWNTGTVYAGHKVVGRTYLVPGTSNQMDTDGTIKSTGITLLNGAVTNFLAAAGPQFGIWSRPFPGRDASAGPPPVAAKPAHDGKFVECHSGVVHDKVAVLRSRRD